MAQKNLKKHGKKHDTLAEKIVFWLLFLSMAGSVIFVTVRLILTWGDNSQTHSDYQLMLLQCVAGLVVIFLPMMIEHRWKIQIPSSMCIMYFAFLYCAIYLGEVRSFYTLVPHWDTILHTFSGFMLGALGFIAVDLLNQAKRVHVWLSPVFVCLFAFCFAVAFGALWEIWEFSWDSALGLNMQKYIQNGKELVGHAALVDTMKDIIVDTLGALVVTLIGGLSLHHRKKALVAGEPDPEDLLTRLEPESQADIDAAAAKDGKNIKNERQNKEKR